MKKFTETVVTLHEAEAGAKSELQKSYKDYFSAKLNKFGAKSPADLTPEQKTEFFNEIKKDWERGVGAKEAGKKDVEEYGVKESEEVNEGDKPKVGDELTMAKDGRKGKVVKCGADQCDVDFGDGDIYGIVYRRIKDGMISESEVNEKEIKDEAEFKEYAQTVLKKAFADKYDEEKANKTIDGILKKSKGDYGAAVGMLTSGLSEGNKFGAAVKKAKEEGKEEFEVDGKTYKVKEHEVTNEGKLSGGRYPEFQMDFMNNGIRLSDITISTGLYGGDNLSVKVGMYSGGGDWNILKPGKKVDELTKTFKQALKDSRKDPSAVQFGEDAEKQLREITEAMQQEIFEAIVKELDSLDKKIEKIVNDVINKN